MQLLTVLILSPQMLPIPLLYKHTVYKRPAKKYTLNLCQLLVPYFEAVKYVIRGSLVIIFYYCITAEPKILKIT